MKVHLRFLRQASMLQEALRNDGWKLEPEKGESLCACHPDVPDESSARSRLHRLGFLTSPALWIEFQSNRAQPQLKGK
jgi:hypothetical protein